MNEQAKPTPPMVILRDQLNDRTVQFQHALPKHLPPERFFRVVLTAVQLNPDLLACNRMSLFNSALRCAQDGLLPDGREAALVPFKDKVQYLIMYQGILKRFRNSGQFKWIGTGIVREGDQFEYWVDETGPHFKHVPTFDENPDKKIICVYAAATTKDDAPFFRPLSLADINKRRNMSRGTREDAPWKQWWEEMAQKTAIRVLSRYLPTSSDLDDLIRSDEELYDESESEATGEVAARSEAARGAALDHFAAGLPGQDEDRAQLDETARHEEHEADSSDVNTLTQAQEPPQEQTRPESKPRTQVEPQSQTAPDLLVIARERGRADRDKGMQRKATPIEYRDPTRAQEALAWRAGWDEADGRS